jgi:hypothetical protein
MFPFTFTSLTSTSEEQLIPAPRVFSSTASPSKLPFLVNSGEQTELNLVRVLMNIVRAPAGWHTRLVRATDCAVMGCWVICDCSVLSRLTLAAYRGFGVAATWKVPDVILSKPHLHRYQSGVISYFYNYVFKSCMFLSVPSCFFRALVHLEHMSPYCWGF